MRVYLHHLAWEQDPEGFKDRMAQYLDIADKYGISTLFVFLDDCWNESYAPGKQPEPKTGVHNSGWVQDPGKEKHNDPEMHAKLEEYVKDVMNHFANDQRIVLWDLYNEPGNSGYGNESLPLLKKMFQWGREANPSQPLSVGVWNIELEDLNEYQLEHSDIVTYHDYKDKAAHQATIDSLKTIGRPLVCTEYMARTRDSYFETIMPMLKTENIGAYNWGLVSGKTNTIYAWDDPHTDGSQPKVWFHDIFRKDGTPYDPKEVTLIKQLTGKN